MWQIYTSSVINWKYNHKILEIIDESQDSIIMKKKSVTAKIARFIFRMISGLATIFLADQVLLYAGISGYMVGINIISALTCGILGVPGAALLFSLFALKNL